MTSPFERPARPWDLFNKELGRVETEVAEQRMAICRECPLYVAGVCQDCHCIMALKTKLPNAECPQHKWGRVRVLQDTPQKIAIVIDGVVQDVIEGDDRLMSLLASNPTLVAYPTDVTVTVGEAHA